MPTSRKEGLHQFDNIEATKVKLDSVEYSADIGDATASTATSVPLKVLRIPIQHAKSNAERRTGINLPAKAIVHDVLLDVQTLEATGGTKTINIGTYSVPAGGDADGFAVGVSVAAAAVVRPQATVTVGGTETYFSANTRGALLADYQAGDNVATDTGLYRERPYMTASATAKEITWTMGSNDFEELVADIVILYSEF
jgi:hypothetical protein